jgi:hypothetical protein
MSATQIFHALQEFDGGRAASCEAAKAGFLEWAMGLGLETDAACEAQRALLHIEALPEDGQAEQLFLEHLKCASRVLPHPKRRGGAKARRRMLH